MINYFLKKNRGFTVLFAVIVSSLILAIGISIGNITLKQIRISSLGRESQVAFYAADSGAECVLYYDLIEGAFGTTSDTATIDCFGHEAEVLFDVDGDADDEHATSTVIISDSAGAGADLCANVEIGKHDTNGDGYFDRTVILSRGYNLCDGDPTRLLERGIRIRY